MNDLNDLLKCPNCNSFYDTPNVLPCGKTICTSCLKIILYKINKTCKQFKCFLCTDYHSLPKDNKFPVCEPLLRLSKKRSNEDYLNRCELSATLKANLNNVKTKMNLLKKSMWTGNDQIKEYCTKAKNEVKVRTELLKNLLNHQSECMIGQIDEYEKECLTKFSEKDDFRNDLNKNVTEIAKSNTEAEEYLNTGIGTVDEDNKFIAQSLQAIDLLNLKIKQYESTLFNNQTLSFTNSHELDPEQTLGRLIGKLEIRTTPKTVLLDKLKKISLNQISIKPFVLNVSYIDSARLFIASKDNQTLKFQILDAQTGASFDEYTEKNSNLEISNTFNSNNGNDLKIVVNVLEIENRCNYLKLFNSELQLQHQIKIFDNLMIGTDSFLSHRSEQIYCISRTSSSSHIRIYNWKLEFLNSIGQSNDSNKKYFFSSSAKKLIQACKKYYVLGDKCFSILDEETGDLLKNFEISADDFHVDESSRSLCFFLRTEKKLKSYSLRGEFDYEINLAEFKSDDLIVIFKSNCKISFFDKVNLVFYE